VLPGKRREGAPRGWPGVRHRLRTAQSHGPRRRPKLGLWTNEVTLPTTGSVGGNLVKAAIGGGPAATLASGQSYPTAIAVDGVHAVWGNSGEGGDGGSIMKVVY